MQEQVAHMVVVTGAYKNDQYGLIVPRVAEIPAFRNAPPNPNHGILFFLGGHRTIAVSAEFDAAEYGSTTAQLDQLLKDLGAADVQRERVMLSGAAAEQARFRTPEGLAVVIAQRRAARGGILYQLQLSTDAAHFADDDAILERIRKGIKIKPPQM